MSQFHLAIDTSTSRSVVAVLNGETLVSSWIGPAGTQHNETLLAGIHECVSAAKIKLSDLQWLDLGVGPGMFTGLRVGVATAKFLAESQGIKISPVSSLLALNLSAKASTRVFALSDARSGRIYVLKLEGAERSVLHGTKEAEEVALQPPEVAALLAPNDLLIGEAAIIYKEHWPIGTQTSSIPEEHIISAYQVGLIGLSLFQRGLALDPLHIEPRYLKTGQKYL